MELEYLVVLVNSAVVAQASAVLFSPEVQAEHSAFYLPEPVLAEA